MNYYAIVMACSILLYLIGGAFLVSTRWQDIKIGNYLAAVGCFIGAIAQFIGNNMSEMFYSLIFGFLFFCFARGKS